jgi:hypothetical protein
LHFVSNVCALHGSVQLSHLIQHLDTEKHKHTKRGLNSMYLGS